jgi:hypothetical protein
LFLICLSAPASSSFQAFSSTIAALAFMYYLYNLISFNSFANLSSSSFLSFFFLFIFSYASIKPCSLICCFLSSSSSCYFFFSALLWSFSAFLLFLASSIFDAVERSSSASLSFLAMFYYLFNSVSCSSYLLLNSILSLSSAIDISSSSP